MDISREDSISKVSTSIGVDSPLIIVKDIVFISLETYPFPELYISIDKSLFT